ncbi:MAG: hypothetical protein AB8G05_27755 [Oligoflexales bacterium]
MKFFQRMAIDRFVNAIINEDRDILKISEGWNIEREEVIGIVVDHFNELGIYLVDPMEHAQTIYDNIVFQLKYSPVLRSRIQQVNRDIDRAKARHNRRHNPD